MGATALVTLRFAVLLGLEPRYQLLVLRLATAAISLVVLLFAQRRATNVARYVVVAPPDERITQLHGHTISGCESGETTMVEALDHAIQEGFTMRLIALGALFWLASSPALRRADGRGNDRQRARDARGVAVHRSVMPAL